MERRLTRPFGVALVTSFVRVVALAAFPALATNGYGGQSPAEMMAALAQPPQRERERVRKRFEFLLPRFVSRCPDVETEENAADFLYFAFNEIRDAGIAEDLLGLSDRLYQVVRDTISAEPQCREVFVLYAVLRQEGMSPPDATKGLTDLINALGRIGKGGRIPGGFPPLQGS